MNKKPLISVVMPVYNTPVKYLKESIDSILLQTYKNFEFIIIDDGTTKEEVELIKSYKDKRIRLYHNEKNIGLAKSINKGVELANSKYIMRMDSDDIAYPERFDKQMDFALKNPQYAMIGTCASFFTENNEVVTETSSKGEIEKKDFLVGTPIIHPTLLIKKEALEKIGGYPIYRRCEDYAMQLEMYCNKYRGYIMKDVLMKIRRTNSYKKRSLKNRLESCGVRWKYFRKMKIKWYEYIWILKPLVTGKLFYFLKKNIIKDCR